MYVCLLQAYHDPMLKLSIMTEQELNQIFGTLDSLIPLHEGKRGHLVVSSPISNLIEHAAAVIFLSHSLNKGNNWPVLDCILLILLCL